MSLRSVSQELNALSTNSNMRNQSRSSHANTRTKTKADSGVPIIVFLFVCCLLLAIFIRNKEDRATPEKVFSASCAVGDKVYIEVTNIDLEYGIYDKNSTTYDHFLCKCKTTKSGNVWVYISVSSFKEHFSSDVPVKTSDDKAAPTIKYDTPIIIHGRVRKSDSLADTMDVSEAIHSELAIEFSSLSTALETGKTD